MRACDLEIVRVDGAAVTADNTRPPAHLDALTDFIFHLDLILIGHNYDPAVVLILVRDHQLIKDRKDLRGPAKNDCMVRFKDQ